MKCFLLFLFNFALIPKFTILTTPSYKYSKEYHTLVNWITINGGYVSPKFKPVEIDKSNRYIIANEKINKNEELLFVPNKNCISFLHPLINPLCRKLGDAEDLKTLFDCILYYFTIDHFNKNSFFIPYYNYLPSLDINNFIIGFPKTKENSKLFFLTQLENEIESFNHHFLGSKERLESFLPKQITDKQFLTNFLYIASRNFSRRGSEFFPELNNLVPFFDLLNHYNNYNTYYYYNDERNGYILYSLEDISPGNEITISYGKLTNSRLLGAYGFVLKNNKYKASYNLRIRNELFTMKLTENPKKEIITFLKSCFNVRRNEKKELLGEATKELEKRMEELKKMKFDCKIEKINICIEEVIELMELYYRNIIVVLDEWNENLIN